MKLIAATISLFLLGTLASTSREFPGDYDRIVGIEIPDIAFKETPLPEFAAALSRRVRELTQPKLPKSPDSKPVPQGRANPFSPSPSPGAKPEHVPGIDPFSSGYKRLQLPLDIPIHIDPPPAGIPIPTVTLHLSRQPLSAILEVACEKIGWQWTIREDGIHLFTSAYHQARHRKYWNHPFRKTLRSIIVPEFEFDDAPLSRIIQHLQNEAIRQGHPIGFAFNLADFDTRFLTYSGKFQNNDIDEILEVLAARLPIDWSIRDGIVTLGAHGANPRVSRWSGRSPYSTPRPFDPFVIDPLAMPMRWDLPLPLPPTAPSLETAGRLPPPNHKNFPDVRDNPFESVGTERFDRIPVDVGTTSFPALWHLAQCWSYPSPDAARIEEMVNFFKYDYPAPEPNPKGKSPTFRATVESAPAFWNPAHQLVRIGIKARPSRPPANLVILLHLDDDHYSYANPGDHPLAMVKSALLSILPHLRESDRISILLSPSKIAWVPLPSATGNEFKKIRGAIFRLRHTYGATDEKIVARAFAIAEENYIPDGINRVLFCTIQRDRSEANVHFRLALEEHEKVDLSVLAFGRLIKNDPLRHFKNSHPRTSFAQIETGDEARRLFSNDGAGLFTVAKDTSIQVTFNPETVASYRRIGYENTPSRADNPNKDTTRGAIGAGREITALYEIVPAPKADLASADLLTVRIIFDTPGAKPSRRITHSQTHRPNPDITFDAASPDFRFAAAVASFGMVIRNSPHRGESSFPIISEIVAASAGKAPDRALFLKLVNTTGGFPLRNPDKTTKKSD